MPHRELFFLRKDEQTESEATSQKGKLETLYCIETRLKEVAQRLGRLQAGGAGAMCSAFPAEVHVRATKAA